SLLFKIFAATMTYLYGRVFLQQNHGNWLANQIGASYYDCSLTFDRQIVTLEQNHYSLRRARTQTFLAGKKQTHVVCVKTIYIFFRKYGLKNSLGRQGSRQRELD